MDFSVLPPINATLNAIATVLLVVGRRLARRGEVERHRIVMIAAFGVSSLFLLFYVSHKVSRNFVNTTFNAEGWVKVAYLVLLGSHILLAMTVPIFAIALSNPPAVRGCTGHSARLITLENDSLGIRRARRSLS